MGGGCVVMISGNADGAVEVGADINDGDDDNFVDDDDDADSAGLSSIGFGDIICFVASFTVETTELIGDDMTAVEDVTSHFVNVANGFCCCCCGWYWCC